MLIYEKMFIKDLIVLTYDIIMLMYDEIVINLFK